MSIPEHECVYVPTDRWTGGDRILECPICGDTDLDPTEPPPDDRCPVCGSELEWGDETESANSPNGTGYSVLWCVNPECEHEVDRRWVGF